MTSRHSPRSSDRPLTAGSLSLLEDEDKDVRVYALQHLLAIVPQFWAEISDKLPLLSVSILPWPGLELTTRFSELLADPFLNELPIEHRPYAALLVAKVYYYIGELEEAVLFALKAGKTFEQEPQGEFRETIIGRSPFLMSSRLKIDRHVG